MNKYYQKFKEQAILGSRDPVFIQIIYNWFKYLDKPNILNIGSERSLDLASRGGDGWANFYWAELVQINGGKLTIVDVDPEAISVSKTMLEDFVEKIDINFVIGSGLDIIDKESYTFQYHDGPDDNKFTLDCIQKVDREKCSILCDDANRGGKCDLVRMLYPDYWLLPCNYVHEMIFYPSKQLQQTILNK